MCSGPSSRNSRLVIDDRLRHAGERAAALLDRLDQPLGRVHLALDVVAGLGRRGRVLQQLAVVRADVERRQIAVFEVHLVLARFVLLDEHVGRHGRGARLGEVGARLRLERAEVFPRFLNRLDREAGLLRDQRQAVVLEVFEVMLDEHLQLFVEQQPRRELQQQALLEAAGADARRIEPLHDRQRLLGELQLRGPPRRARRRSPRPAAAESGLPAATSDSRCESRL